MKLKAILGLAAGLLTFASSSQAGLFHFSGEIEYHNDVVYTYFTLDEDINDVRVWTDSSNSGANFDPITMLWNADGSMILGNDDNTKIGTGQSGRDSGFTLTSLTAGEYIVTLGTYYNLPNNFSDISDGFSYDTQPGDPNSQPIPIEEWDQPLSGLGLGSYWSIWLDGVSNAHQGLSNAPTTSIPEPSSFILLLFGVLGLGLARKRAA